MSNYTKGPWKVVTTSDGFISIGNEESVEMTGHSPTYFKPVLADVWRDEDARLIAAAPELLEALKKVACRRLEDGTFCFCDIPTGHQFLSHEQWCNTARSAIAKAEAPNV